MRIFFSILSIAYIGGIFILADSPMVSDFARFNPYSLLHIPVYGILTVFLVFSFVPIRRRSINPISPTNSINPTNSTNRFLVAGFVALAIAIADEIHQAYVPGRDSSATDVLLDTLGISLVVFIIFRRYKKTTQRRKNAMAQ